MGIYIARNKRDQLLKYKYSSTDKSLTSKYILNPYWNRLILLFPLNMAPNAITLSGLCCVFINFLTLLYFNPTLSCGVKPTHITKGGPWDPLSRSLSVSHATASSWNPLTWFGGASVVGEECAPRWLYFTFSVGLFFYQSLDAIDGKQARRTGTSGPLGELFDHGCDAINTTLEVILTASALNLGLSWWTVICLVATNANFYLTTWEEYHTGTLYLSAFSGPVEGILMIIVVYAITGVVGPQFWDKGILTVTGLNSIPGIASLGLKDLPLNDFFLTFSGIALLFNIISSSRNVLASLPLPHSPTSLLKPLTRLTPYILHTTFQILWLYFLPSSYLLSRETLVAFLVFWGLTFAHHVGLLILAHLTKSEFPAAWKHPLLFVSALGALDARFGLVQRSDIWTERVVAGCTVLATLVYGHFVWEVVGDICEFYDINCLTIKHKKKDAPPSPAKRAAKALQIDYSSTGSGDEGFASAGDKKKRHWGLKKK
ncbi:Cholinephosphotransferase [Meredithblackwellia eburnea MCA 4105]